MAAENEYTIQIGIDASPFNKGLQKMKDDIDSLQKFTRQSTNAMGDSFAAVSKVVSRMGEDAVKSVRSITNEAKTLVDYSKPLRNMFSNLDTKGIDGAGSALKGVTKQLDNLLSKAKENKGIGPGEDDINQIDEYQSKIDNLENALEKLKEVGVGVFEKLTESAEKYIAMLDAITKHAGDVSEATASVKPLPAAGAPGSSGGGTEGGKIKVEADSSTLEKTIDTVKEVTTVLGTAKEAAAMFGDEGVQVAHAIQKFSDGLGLMQKLLEIGAVLDKNSALNQKLRLLLTNEQTVATGEQAAATGADAAAKGADAAATEGATAAQWGLNAAMDANPAGALLLVITALIAAFSLFGDDMEAKAQDAENYNKLIEEQTGLFVDLAKANAESATRDVDNAQKQLNLAQAQGASEGELYEKRQALNKAKIEEGQLILANLGLDANDVRQKELQLTQQKNHLLLVEKEFAAQQKAAYEAGKQSEEETKRQNAILETLKGNIKNLETIVGAGKEAVKQISDAQSQSDQDAAARQKQLHDEGLKSAVAAAEAKLDTVQKGSYEEYKAQLDVIQARYNQEIQADNLTKGEKIKIYQDYLKAIRDLDNKTHEQAINQDIAGVQTRLNKAIEGSQDEFAAKNDLLQLQMVKEIEAAKISGASISEIESRYDKQRAELKTKFDLQTAANAIHAEENNINAKLAVVQKGSEDELKLKQDLVDKEAELARANATATIKDSTLLASALNLINSKALADRTELQKNFYTAQINKQEAYNQSVLGRNNAFLQSIVDDTTKTDKEKFKAKQQILQNELTAIGQQIEEQKKLADNDIANKEQYLNKINDLEAQKTKITSEIAKNNNNNIPKFNIQDSLFKGLGFNTDDPRQKEMIGNVMSTVSKAYEEITKGMEEKAQRQIDAIQKVIDATQQQIDQQQEIVDKEKKLSDEGLANDLTNQQKKLDDLKKKKDDEVKAREEAAKKLAEIRKTEAAIQAATVVATNIETAVNMVNAASKIFGSFSAIPFGVGIAIAVGIIASMYASFNAIKKAFTASSADVPKMRRGGGFLLDGPSHEDGGIGLYSGGRKLAEYEGDEYLFAINRNSTRKYLPLLEAINGDRLPAMQAILQTGRLPMDDVQQLLVTHREVEDINISSGIQLHNRQWDSLKHLHHLSSIEKALTVPKKEISDMGDHILEREGNRVRKIRKG